MDIVGLLRKEGVALMGKVNAVDAAQVTFWCQYPTSKNRDVRERSTP